MKQLLVMLAAGLLVLSLAACGGGTPASSQPASGSPADLSASSSDPAPSAEAAPEENTGEEAPASSEAAGDAPEAALDGSAATMMEPGTLYPYETLCSEDTTLSTRGQASLTRHDVVDSDEAHPAKEGYQWHLLEFTVTYSDENAWNYGMQNRVYDLNWYTGAPYDYPDPADPELFTMEWQGQQWECRAATNVAEAQWSEDQVFTYRLEIAYQLPQGYDGVALVLFDSAYTADGTAFPDAAPAIMSDPATLCYRVM